MLTVSIEMIKNLPDDSGFDQNDRNFDRTGEVFDRNVRKSTKILDFDRHFGDFDGYVRF